MGVAVLKRHKPHRRIFMFARSIGVVLLLVWALATPFNRVANFGSKNLDSNNDQRIHPIRLLKLANPTIQNTSHQVIAVSPDVPNYSNPVYNATLFHNTFGNSYGSPFQGTWLPPNGVNFNRIVATIRTSVSGRQYDRLAHFSVAGTEVWRTSTIEPAGNLTYSVFSKDLSDYVALFQTLAPFEFELNNIVDGSLNGAFDITVSFELYDEEKDGISLKGIGKYEKSLNGIEKYGKSSNEINESFTSVDEMFGKSRPADSVYPLTQQNNVAYVSVATSAYTTTFPSVSSNTTRLTLRMIASGNGNEEFWYSNTLDQWGGQRGPIRVVNVYVDGKKVAAQTPEPVLFTGGVSPLLWGAIVCTDAFDLPTIDLDVTALLPFAQNSSKISVEVSNGIGEYGAAANTSTLENWFLSAVLLAWESPVVTKSSGDVTIEDGYSHGQVVYHSLNGTSSNNAASEVQGIDSRHGGGVLAHISYLFVNGSLFDISASLSALAKVANVQTNNYTSQVVAHYGELEVELHIDGPNGEVYAVSSTLRHPLMLDSNQVSLNSSISQLIITLEHAKGVHSNTTDSFVEASIWQGGNSRFLLATYVLPGANGTLLENFQYTTGGAVENRILEADNYVDHVNTVHSDQSFTSGSVKDAPILDASTFVTQARASLNLNGFGKLGDLNGLLETIQRDYS